MSGPSTLRVEGPVDHGGLDESVLPKVAAVDGVEAAVPLVLTITQAVDGDGDVVLIPAIGVDCGIEAVTGTFGCTPELLRSLRGGPAIGRSLRDRLGSDGMVRTDLREIAIGDAPVVGALDGINDGRVALFDLGSAQREFVRPGGVDAILVVPEPGVTEADLAAPVQRAVGSHNHVVVDPTSPLASSLVAQLVLPFMFLISLVGLLIGAQLVRNTIELALEERRRELATSAALGASPATSSSARWPRPSRSASRAGWSASSWGPSWRRPSSARCPTSSRVRRGCTSTWRSSLLHSVSASSSGSWSASPPRSAPPDAPRGASWPPS